MPIRRPWPEALGFSIGAGALVGVLGTVPLLGIPGALALIPATPFIAMMSRSENFFPNDSAWPFALMMTWIMGALLPLAWMATRRWRGLGRAVAFLGIWTLLTTAGAVALYGWGIAGA